MKLGKVLLIPMLMLALAACGKPDAPVTPSISIKGSHTLSIPAAAYTGSVSLTASLSWIASSDAAWIKVNPTVGTRANDIPIEITVEENFGLERTGAVTFSISGTSTSVNYNVTQAASESATSDDPPLIEGDPVLSVDFTKGLGAFEVQDISRGSFPEDLAIWGTNASHPEYGAVAQAYVSATGKRYKTESWLVSPRVNLKGHNQLYLRFSHALNYTGDEKDFSKFIGVKISADKGDTWEAVTIPNMTSGNSFEFVSSGDIDLRKYKDKIIQLAFTYKSTDAVTPTWEISKLLITSEKEVITKDDLGDEYKSVPKWMELPEIKDASAYRIHTAPIGEKNYRNYSYLFDSKNMVALWVAYPLCDLYTKKTVQRTDKWAFDPFLAEDAQPAYFKAGNIYDDGKGGAKYNRGHQLPSADRLASTRMNEQTFYFTNIAPQLADKAFNAGVWGDLETAVRGWSSASNSTDSLYVVTGCLVDKPLEYRKDNNNKQVSIPNAFYKAIVRLSKGSYIGAAFYLDHKNYQNQPAKLKDFALSIKELEEKTGLTFFVNLPSDKAAAIKAENPKNNSFWNLK